MHALDPLGHPVAAALGGPQEGDVGAGGIGAVALHGIDGAHRVALRRGHLGAAHRDHPLGEQARERLLDAQHAHVRERLGEEARVHQVEDRVLDAADVLVDRHPVVGHVPIERKPVVVGVEVAQEVPRRVDEGVHGVGLAARGSATPRTGRVDPVLRRRERAAALGRVVLDVGELDRQLLVGHRDDAVGVAVDDRDRAAPVALAGEQPVAKAVVDRGMAESRAARGRRRSRAWPPPSRVRRSRRCSPTPRRRCGPGTARPAARRIPPPRAGRPRGGSAARRRSRNRSRGGRGPARPSARRCRTPSARSRRRTSGSARR